MRLPWPLGRRTSPAGPPSTAQGDGVSGSDSVSGTHSPSADPAPTGAWATLPPIQRTIATAPLIAPSSPFLDDVPGHRPLPPIVQPLGHEAGPSAPAGLVAAHPRPIDSLTSHRALPTRPVQRHAGAAATTAEDAVAWGPVAGTADGAPAQAASATTPPHDAETSPVRHLPAVAPGAAVMPPSQPLTRTTTLAPARGPVVPRGAEARAPGAGANSPTRVAARTVSRWAEAPSATPSSASPGPAGAAASPDGGLRLAPRRTASEAPSGHADARPARDSASGDRRRAGLGAPIPVQPASAVAQRLPARTPVREPSRPAAAATAATGPGPGPREPDTTAAAPLGATPAPRLPVLHVARRQSGEPTSAPAPGHVPDGGSPADRRAPGHEAAIGANVTRPTMGRRPLRPGATTQRQVATTGLRPAAGGSSTAPGPTPAAAPVPVRPEGLAPAAAASWGTVDLPGGMREITFPPRDVTAGIEAPVDASGLRGPGRAELPVQRIPGDPAADPGTTAFGDVSGSRPAPGGGRSAAEPRGPLALARPVFGPGSHPSAGTAAPAATAPVVARLVADPVNPSAPPTVQAASGRGGSGGTPVAAITATPVIQRVDGAAPPAAPDGVAHSETELDELARALFGRIQSHLRAEVIHEREAKGLTFDAF